MGLVPIDRTRWPRRAHYEWVQKTGQGPFAVTVPLDVTLLAGEPLYPALLWLLTQGVNEMEAFRTVATPEGLGIYDHMDPAYTVFHPQEKPFRCSGRPFIRITRSSRQPISAMWRPTGLPRHGCPRASVRRIPSMSPWCPGCPFRRFIWRPPPSALICSPFLRWESGFPKGRRGFCPSRYKSIRGCAIPSTFISCRCGSRRALRGFPAGEKALDFPGRAVYNKGTTL